MLFLIVSNLHLYSSLTVLLIVSELQVLHYKSLIHLELFAVKGETQQPNLIHLLTKLSFLQHEMILACVVVCDLLFCSADQLTYYTHTHTQRGAGSKFHVVAGN